MKDLNYQFMKLCRQNRDGGFSAQATRSRKLGLVANGFDIPMGKQHKCRFRMSKLRF